MEMMKWANGEKLVNLKQMRKKIGLLADLAYSMSFSFFSASRKSKIRHREQQSTYIMLSVVFVCLLCVDGKFVSAKLSDIFMHT